VRITHHDIILVVEELIVVGGVGCLMQGFVQGIGIGGGVLNEGDVVLGNLLGGKLRDTVSM
jgi:hypothetical protein